jgi:hypothetical protein
MNFTEAITTTAELLRRLESEPANDELRESLAKMLSTTEGARGFFVSLLTGDSTLADRPEPWLYQVFKANEEIVCELLVKNLVMSTATQITHLRNSDQQAADGSNQVARRTGKLIDGFQSARLNAVADEMLFAIDCKISGKCPSESDRLSNFLQRWSYDEEQLHAARQALAAHL